MATVIVSEFEKEKSILLKYVRWIGIVILIILMGYLSAFGLFSDSSIVGGVGVVLVFLAGCAGMGALNPKRWQLSALCSWGAVIFSVLEIGSTVARGPVPGQHPTAQALLIGIGAVGLALLGGYIGFRIRTRNR